MWVVVVVVVVWEKGTARFGLKKEQHYLSKYSKVWKWWYGRW